MKISEKWSALFHNVLQIENTVTPPIAREALVLIGWISNKWTDIQKAEKYYDPDATLVQEFSTVLAALRARAHCRPLTGPWPSALLTAWGRRNPFLPVVSEEILKNSDWETLYELMLDVLPMPEAPDENPLSAIWVISFSEPLRKAWEKALQALLPGNRLIFRKFVSVAALPRANLSAARAYLIFGSPWDAQAQTASLETWQQRYGPSSPLTVINSNSVAEVLWKILEHHG